MTTKFTTKYTPSPYVRLTSKELSNLHSKCAAYLPVYDTTTRFPATEPFDFEDRGHHAEPAKPNLLSKDNSALKAV